MPGGLLRAHTAGVEITLYPRDIRSLHLTVIIMIVSVALFIRLVQTIFVPSKVRYECLDCGLTRHDRDAVHCKHCGRQLHIRTEGVVS